jgi:hypothetical protein
LIVSETSEFYADGFDVIEKDSFDNMFPIGSIEHLNKYTTENL